MSAEARRFQIIDYIGQAGNGVVSVSNLAQRLGVSEMTIRRDLDWLEKRSILTRVHGGAIAFQSEITQMQAEKPFGLRLNESNPQKKSIGWAAAKLVQDGNRIILDAGTTTQQIARNLGGKDNLTVITNNIPISTELSRYEQIETILLGGQLKHRELCTIGPMVKQELAILSVDIHFLSAAGFSVRHGATDPDMREVEIKQAMIQASSEVILVADSSKFGLVELVKICPIDSLNKIVTDDSISPQAVIELEAEGIEVITPQRIAQREIISTQE
jgi:DeoR family fructose operon transcriptional repressor